ncbi:MAG: TrmJ/YjtD family RNA methyltransferase [Candidatus Thorarchaeota archaeon]
MAGLPNLVVVLVEPQTAGNVGFTARVMANFGVTRLRLVGIDHRQEEDARKFSMHSLDLLESAEIFDTLEDALADIQNAWAATARAGRNHSVTRALVPLRDLPDPTTYNEQIALVFGRESSGLTNEEIDLCSLGFNIPTSNEYQSMNLSHAVGVTLFHLYTEYAPEEERMPTEARVATKEERRQTSIFFDEIVDELSIKDFRRPIAKRVFRNLMDRAYMTGREITTLTGTVRKIRDRILGKSTE